MEDQEVIFYHNLNSQVKESRLDWFLVGIRLRKQYT